METQMAGMIGGQEILIILIVVLILFGGKKIPELMRGLGKGVKEYKNAVKGFEDSISDDSENEHSSSQKSKSGEDDKIDK